MGISSLIFFDGPVVIVCQVVGPVPTCSWSPCCCAGCLRHSSDAGSSSTELGSGGSTPFIVAGDQSPLCSTALHCTEADGGHNRPTAQQQQAHSIHRCRRCFPFFLPFAVLYCHKLGHVGAAGPGLSADPPSCLSITHCFE
jgi:hypothetical protein